MQYTALKYKLNKVERLRVGWSSSSVTLLQANTDSIQVHIRKHKHAGQQTDAAFINKQEASTHIL